MTDAIEQSRSLLIEHGYVVGPAAVEGPRALLFENNIVMGFVVAYEDVPALLNTWRRDSTSLLERHQLGLRRSMDKAWNSYLVLLSEQKADRLQQALLDSIEEDLIGMRKVARSGLRTREDTARALLPLLPLQSPPNLAPVDMVEEIRIRSSQLPAAAVDAFFSTRDTSTVLQLLEEL